ncbi:uncharacterized protein RB166_007071 [Leptodactylus fuscus]
MVEKKQEVQELGADRPPWLGPSVKQESLLEDHLCTRYQENEVATQTRQVYCFHTVDEMMEFLHGDIKCEEQSAAPPSGQTPPTENHTRTLKLETEEEDDDEEQPMISQLYPLLLCPPFPAIKRRRKQRFQCDWQGAVMVISSPSVPAHAMELRVDEDLAMSIRRQVDINNPGPFGWQLAKLLFTEEELYGHNFNGTDQKMPLSPRRVHAIQHAFHHYFPKDMADEALAKGRTAINQGIRNMFYVRNRRDGDVS